MNTNDDVIEIDLQELIGLLLYKLWLIIICAVIGAAGAFVISKFFITPLYESTTSVYILNKNENSTITYNDVQLGTQLTKDYAQMIKSRDVLEGVIEVFYLEDSYKDFSERVAVTTPSDTRMIQITVTDEEPFMAQQLANEVRKLAADKITEVMDIQAVNTVDEANLPEKPASPSVFKWTAIGGVLGIVLCAAVLIIKFLMDDTIKTAEDVEKYLQLSTLASIPVKEEENKKQRRKHGKSEKESVVEVSEEDEEDEDADEQDTLDVRELINALGTKEEGKRAAGAQTEKTPPMNESKPVTAENAGNHGKESK